MLQDTVLSTTLVAAAVPIVSFFHRIQVLKHQVILQHHQSRWIGIWRTCWQSWLGPWKVLRLTPRCR
jgi:hypothetical protein